MQSYLEHTATALSITKSMITPRDESLDHDPEDSLEGLISQLDSLIAQSRSSKVVSMRVIHSISELKARSMSVVMDTSEAFEHCKNSTMSLAALARQLGEHILAMVASEIEEDVTSRTNLRNAFSNFKSPILEETTTQSPLPAMDSRLRIITTQLSSLTSITSDLHKTAEFERGQAPWIIRANALKATKLVSVSTEEELKRLKDDMHEKGTQLRIRDQTLEEQAVKIEILESRTRDANAKASKITDLQRAVEASKVKEKELSTAIDKHVTEATKLKFERDHFKHLADERSIAAPSDGNVGPNKARGAAVEGAVATAREMDVLRTEIDGLQGAVRFLRDENRRVRLADPQEAHMAWLTEPLIRETSTDESQFELLSREGGSMLAELLDIVLDQSSSGIDLTTLPANKLAWRPAKEKSQWRVARQAEQWALWGARRDGVLRKGREMQRLAHVDAAGLKSRAAAFDSGVAGLDADELSEVRNVNVQHEL